MQSIVTDVIPKVAPVVLSLLQQRRRELGLPEERDAASTERDLGSFLNILLPKLIDAVPAIASAISGKPAPRGPEEETERFLPILASLIPSVISAVPQIISAFNSNVVRTPACLRFLILLSPNASLGRCCRL